MNNIIHTSKDKLTPKHQSEHQPYEYFKYEAVGAAAGNQCIVNFYELPPSKSNYPYHFHAAIEEVFYIISGEGLLRTPEGERVVSPGDVLVFPPSSAGAHKLTNTSKTETLTYLDVDTVRLPEVVIYPDSDKIGIISKDVRAMFMKDNTVDY
jgi:uncharacterized cupin superfamily protein